jgi:hypothetical protein
MHSITLLSYVFLKKSTIFISQFFNKKKVKKFKLPHYAPITNLTKFDVPKFQCLPSHLSVPLSRGFLCCNPFNRPIFGGGAEADHFVRLTHIAFLATVGGDESGNCCESLSSFLLQMNIRITSSRKQIQQVAKKKHRKEEEEAQIAPAVHIRWYWYLVCSWQLYVVSIQFIIQEWCTTAGGVAVHRRMLLLIIAVIPSE